MVRIEIGIVLRLFCALWLLVALIQPSAALQVTGLYNQRIAVSIDSEAERNRAFPEALAAVIVKVSGERRWLQHPTIQRALNNAQSYVELIGFETENLTVPLDAQNSAVNLPPIIEQQYMVVTFSSALIDELLETADIPVWDSNRPSVLVWMALQDENGERRLLTADSEPEIFELLQQFATDRALPIIFPVLDFEDRRTLSVDNLWALDEAAISRASERYGADSVLSGRVLFTAGEELVGLWQFIFQDQTEVFDGLDSELKAYLHASLDRVTNQLANYFAIVPEAANQQNVRLRVDGIKDLTAYSALMNYVNNLGLVETVTPAELDGERLELELGLVGDADQLYELIALDRDLLPIESSMATSRSVLHYRWTR
jgi:hypothetical protein